MQNPPNKCQCCGIEMEPRAYRGNPRKWCSNRCRAWARSHPGQPIPSERACRTCGTDISHRRIDALYCSTYCSDVHHGLRLPEALPSADCANPKCGKRFQPVYRNQRCCSEKCGKRRWQLTTAPQKFPITCLTCGEEHLSARRDGKYCSETCKGIGLRKRYSTALVLWTPPLKRPRTTPGPSRPVRRCWYAGQCVRCSTSFVSDQPRSRYCSRSCLRSDGKDKRRALKREAFVAEVRRTRIFERDRWTCQLCHRKVKRAAVVPDPLAPVLDHIVPLAKGGTHEPANVQCAHFMCNSLKGDRGGGEQLMLIG